MEKDYHSKNKNANLIDIPFVIQLQSFDILNSDGLLYYARTSLNFTNIKVVRMSLEFHLNFNWSNCEWQTLNKKKTTDVLALKDDASIAWLWFISKIKFADLMISLYRGLLIKIRLFKTNYLKLKKKLI